MFNPDGVGTLVLLWTLAIVAIGAFSWYGHHISGRSVQHALGRLVVLVATVLVAVLAVTAGLNARYGWYSSWADMAASLTGGELESHAEIYGASPAKRQQEHAAHAKQDAQTDAATAAKFAHDRSAFEKTLSRPAAGAAGVWVKRNVPGIPVKGEDIGRVMIWIPKSYFSNPHKTYPVIQAFHGIPGGTLDYERVFFLDKLLMQGVKGKHVSEAIIVVPQAMPGGIDTECVNGGGLTMETWLSTTVPDYIVKNLRVKASPSSWMAMGVSAGGWCAAMVGLLHPDRYGAVASLGGYFEPKFADWNPFGTSGVPARYKLTDYIKEHPTDQDIWVLISGGDKVSDASTVAFAKAVREPNSLTTVTYPDAGHRVDVWTKAIPSVLQWVGRTLPGFTPDR